MYASTCIEVVKVALNSEENYAEVTDSNFKANKSKMQWCTVQQRAT